MDRRERRRQLAVAQGVYFAATGIWRELIGLAVGTAAGLALVDVRYAATGRIPPIYLADAAAETALVCAWAAMT